MHLATNGNVGASAPSADNVPADLGFSVLFLTKYGRKGASSRYRCFQYMPYLRERRLLATVSPLLDDSYLTNRYRVGHVSLGDVAHAFVRRVKALLTAPSYDLIVVEKEILPYLPGPLERLIRTSNIPFAVDYDDAVFHNYDQHWNPFVRSILGSKISGVMRDAALVITGNDYLAEYALKAGARKVAVLPTVIDPAKYPLRTPPTNDKFTIGWIGSPTTSRYVEPLTEMFRMLADECEVRVVMIGAGQIRLPGVETSFLPWVEDEEVFEMQKFDVGIMPLPDEPWARGKCGFKLIQYMACSLPVVASPVGVNDIIVDHGTNGFLARNTTAWLSALRILRDDETLRRSFGQRGREKVLAKYSLDITAPAYVELLRGALLT